MHNMTNPIANIAVSVFAIIVGFNMWSTARGGTEILALLVILVGISALESNVRAVLKNRLGAKREKRIKAGS